MMLDRHPFFKFTPIIMLWQKVTRSKPLFYHAQSPIFVFQSEQSVYLLFSMNISQFLMNFKIFSDWKVKIKYRTMPFIIAINVKNASPYSNMDFTSNTKKMVVGNIICAQRIKKNIFFQLNGNDFWFDSDGQMPLICWHFWTNWRNLIEPAILTSNNQLIPDRSFQSYLLLWEEYTFSKKKIRKIVETIIE